LNLILYSGLSHNPNCCEIQILLKALAIKL
jgi:hypothetical protein